VIFSAQAVEILLLRLSEIGAKRNKMKAKAAGCKKTNAISSENSGKTQQK